MNTAALIAELVRWETLSRTLDPLTAGFEHVARKIENLRLVIARSKKESE